MSGTAKVRLFELVCHLIGVCCVSLIAYEPFLVVLFWDCVPKKTIVARMGEYT